MQHAATGHVLLAFLLGVGTYASDPLGFSHPLLAVASVCGLTLVASLCRLSMLRHRQSAADALLVLALLIYAELMTLATGLTGGPFLGLFALVLWAAALIWRPLAVAALAILIFALTGFQSSVLDRMNDMHLTTSIMVLLDALGPPVAAAWIIAGLRLPRNA